MRRALFCNQWLHSGRKSALARRTETAVDNSFCGEYLPNKSDDEVSHGTLSQQQSKHNDLQWKLSAFPTSVCAQQKKHTCNRADTCERHVKHRWELAALRGGGGKRIWEECMRASVSVPCQWWMCLDSPGSGSLLSDSSPPTPKPDTRFTRGSEAPLAPFVNNTRSHSVEITFALWGKLY